MCAFWMGPGLNIFLRDKDAIQILEGGDSSKYHLMQGEAVYIVFYHMVAIRMCSKSHTYISHKSYQFCITRKLQHSHENSPNKKKYFPNICNCHKL